MLLFLNDHYLGSAIAHVTPAFTSWDNLSNPTFSTETSMAPASGPVTITLGDISGVIFQWTI
jgi:hypothetical protein